VLLGSVVLLCLGSTMSRSALARETWSEVEHIQILEGPEKIWVFVEVVRITGCTDELFAHLMSRHPDVEIVSRMVFTVDRLGNVTKTAIAKKMGPSAESRYGTAPSARKVVRKSCSPWSRRISEVKESGHRSCLAVGSK